MKTYTPIKVRKKHPYFTGVGVGLVTLGAAELSRRNPLAKRLARRVGLKTGVLKRGLTLKHLSTAERQTLLKNILDARSKGARGWEGYEGLNYIPAGAKWHKFSVQEQKSRAIYNRRTIGKDPRTLN
jgi:hypothetical protein